MTYYLNTHLSQNITLPFEVSKLIKKNHFVLDVGCGNGALKKLLPYNRLVGVDVLKDSINLVLKAGYIQAKQVDLNHEKLPFKNNSFDVIICSHILEHLLFPIKATQEMRRVLKSNGFLFISSPTRKNPKFDDDYTHIRPFTPHSLETMLHDAGFSKIEFIHQCIGIPGLGRIQTLFKLNLNQFKSKLSQEIPLLRQTVNVEAIAEK